MNTHGISSKSEASGSALLITLAALVSLTIIIVGFSESMRVERSSAKSHLEATRSVLLAQAGVEEVVSAFHRSTADPARTWISQPGCLIASGTDEGTSKILQTPVPLSSGISTTAIDPHRPDLFPPDLNAATYQDSTTHLITEATDVFAGGSTSGTATKISPKWIYVRKNGDRDPSEPPNTSDAANPIVGRYAYWTDDESSKINYNIAWTRDVTNPYPVSHPTRVGLAGLLAPSDAILREQLARAIHFYNIPVVSNTLTVSDYENLNRTLFDTPLDILAVESGTVSAVPPGLNDALKTQKFNLTHYNSDPDTTFFNEPRIVLTTQESKARGRPYIKILKTPNTDPWCLSAIDNNLYDAAVNKLVGYLTRSDWPMVSGSSTFIDKYFPGEPERLKQFAINIIEYVRSAESAHPLVEPYCGTIDNITKKLKVDESSVNDKVFLGQTRTLLVTEMAMWCSNTKSSNGRYQCRFYVEVHLPKNYGLESVDLTQPEKGKYLYCCYEEAKNRFMGGSNKDYFDSRENQVSDGKNDFFRVDSQHIMVGNKILKAGDYAVISHEFSREFPRNYKQPQVPRVINLKTRIILDSDNGSGRPAKSAESIYVSRAPNAGAGAGSKERYDPTKPLDDPYNIKVLNDPARLVYTLDDTDVTMSISSRETDDPRLYLYTQDWERDKPQRSNTLGRENGRRTVGKPASSITPKQDTDAAGKISAAGLRMPAPAGTTENPLGQVGSPGELGLINTGSTYGLKNESIPWRTLHFQPNSYADTKVVPDWAFMDLFSAPVHSSTSNSTASDLYYPHGTSIAGRVNINAKVTPFSFSRKAPLAAVFLGARTSSTNEKVVMDSATAMQLAENVIEHRLASGSAFIPAGKNYGYGNGYDSPGEIVEIAGIADKGEESEELIRSVGSLLTTRGNVFGVYSIGQSLKQTPAGRLKVTGEQRLHSIVERYLYKKDPNDPNEKGEVRFRLSYYRNLNP